MTNTSSLGTGAPALTLFRTVVSTQCYSLPPAAEQRAGPLPLGSSFDPPGPLPLLDGNDTRLLSLVYAGGRLYATLATAVFNPFGRALVGGAYFVLSPTFRAGVLQARVLRQGYISVLRNNVLRPAVAVNAEGRGAIVFTVAGPDYFPSAGFVPFDTFSTGSTVQIPGLGAFPEDRFTGYPGPGLQGVARWGDYSAAVASTDGSIWMGTEYIPNAPRTPAANWGTFLMRYTP